MNISIGSTSKLVQGHVLDVSLPPLLAALRRYDPQLYLKWNSKKLAGQGCWELRRKPEFKSAQAGRMLETPRGKVYVPGNIYEFDKYTLMVPKYIENKFENHVKDFERLDYRILSWLSSHDLWSYGHKGKNAVNEAIYREAKYDEKIDEDSDAERQYMIKQHKTQFNDFKAYINAGGNPARLVDYWGK